jgi:flagellar biosynthesis/type III secretory pathway M-ring protein FliF/YscJ
MVPAARPDRSNDLLYPRATIGKTPLRVADFERTPERNNDAMVVLALILLVLVAVLVVAIVVSNPDVYDLSIFGAVVPANSAGIFITGAVAMAVTILALLLLRMGIRRGRARRTERKVLLEAAGDKLPRSAASPEETSTTTSKTSDTAATSASATNEPTTPKEKSSVELEDESSTTPAERQAMLDEADALAKDEPQK